MGTHNSSYAIFLPGALRPVVLLCTTKFVSFESYASDGLRHKDRQHTEIALNHGIRREYVPCPASLRDLGPDPDAGARRAVRREHVPSVHADDLGEAVPDAERKTVDEVVAQITSGGGKDRSLSVASQGVWADGPRRPQRDAPRVIDKVYSSA